MKLLSTISGYVSLSVFFLSLSFSGFAQRSFGGFPHSFLTEATKKIAKRPLAAEALPKFDLTKVKKEDKDLGGTSRFAAPLKVNYNLNNAGQWTTLENGDRIWQMKLNSPNAIGLIVMYDDFYLPKGGKFYAYSADKKQILGAFTHESNTASGKFLTGLIKGETTILEYFEPASAKGEGRVNIFRIDHAYDQERVNNDYEFRLHGANMNRGFDTSLDCHVNVNCDAGDDWQAEKRGIVRIMIVVEEGTGWCSGSLMNNAKQDGKPYVLSAFHCDDGFTPEYDFWRFDFNYEGTACSNPAGEPAYQSVLGCNFRSGLRDSDFQLLEMNGLPSGVDVFYNGWNKSITKLPTEGTMIHHPSGDIKKISVDNDDLEVFPNPIQWQENGVTTPANFHLKAVLDLGTFEVGSSGSPVFDEDHRIVGQLNGGNASCSTFLAYYGRLAMSWNQGASASQRLSDWLDPDNSGVESVDGFEGSVSNNTITINGKVTTETGRAIPNVNISYAGISALTDANGNYSFEVEPGEAVFNASKSDTELTRGLSVTDVATITQHALGKITITSPYQLLAADINKSGTLAASDVSGITQVLLGKVNGLPVKQWRFFMLNNSQLVELENVNINFPQTVTLDFIGVKAGDVNQSWRAN